MIITLTGFMGCGKSSVGRELSKLLCCPFMDLDEVIENEQGRKIPEIFESEGEAAFRRMEHEALERIVNEYPSSTGGNLVLALGGGTVMTPECARLVHEHTSCIYLRASVDTLTGHLAAEADGRPMLQSPAGKSDSEALRRRITDLMGLRAETYESVAHHIIVTDGKSVQDCSLEAMTKCISS